MKMKEVVGRSRWLLRSIELRPTPAFPKPERTAHLVGTRKDPGADKNVHRVVLLLQGLHRARVQTRLGWWQFNYRGHTVFQCTAS